MEARFLIESPPFTQNSHDQPGVELDSVAMSRVNVARGCDLRSRNGLDCVVLGLVYAEHTAGFAAADKIRNSMLMYANNFLKNAC